MKDVEKKRRQIAAQTGGRDEREENVRDADAFERRTQIVERLNRTAACQLADSELKKKSASKNAPQMLFSVFIAC